MSQTRVPPFRADHVGSLLRPPGLRQAREQHRNGEMTDDQLRAVEDEAIDEVVRMQGEVGLRTATDGEFRRSSWHMDFIYQLRGISRSDERMAVHFRNAQGQLDFSSAALRVDGKIGLDRTIFGADFDYLATAVRDGGDVQTPKLTIPSPSMVHYRGGRAAIDESVYPDLAEFWADLTAAYSAQIKAIAQRGCRYLQLDDTSLAYLNDPEQRAMIASRGGDALNQHRHNIAALNASLAGRPEGLRVTTHLCRGNYRSSWVAEGGYDYVAEALFTELDVDGFFLEFDDARSGGFEPLRFVPKNKYVVLGLVTTKTGELEDADVLKRRIDEACAYVDLDQLCLSPQCGFSSTEEGNALAIEQQWAKLARIVEVATDVWG